MTSTDVGVGSTSSSSLRESESSNLATVPRIMYRSLQQTTIPAAAAASRAGGVTNDRIPLQRLNDDEYDEVNLGGGEAADLEQEPKKRSKKKRKRKLSEKAPSSILDEK